MAKIADKLVKVNENFTINRYDNGFMIEVTGEGKNGSYATTKIVVSKEDEIVALLKEALALPLND